MWILGLALFTAVFGRNPVPAVIMLSNDLSSVSLPFLITDYDSVTGAATVTLRSAHTLAVNSTRRKWTLSMRTLSNTFIFSPTLGDANPNKPASDLAARAPTEGNVFVPLGTSNQVIGGGNKSRNEIDVPIDYRIQSNLATDPPGTYSITIIYTIVEN